MTEDEIAAVLAASARAIPVPPAPVEAIVATGRRRVRVRRGVQMVAVAVAVVAVLVPLGLGRRVVETAVPSASCGAPVPGMLPEWARAGFSEPEPVMPYLLGDHGAIAALLFGHLTAPPDPLRSNKILWVARDPQPGGTMTITARLVGDVGGAAVIRDFPDGVGPSVLDLPAPGCWVLTVRWPGDSDTLRVRYAAG